MILVAQRVISLGVIVAVIEESIPKGSTLPPGVTHCKRLPEGVAGRLDDDIGFTSVGEVSDFLLNVIHLRVPDGQTAFLRHADAEGIDLGDCHLGGDIFRKLGEQVTDRAKTQDEHIVIGQHL